MTKPFIRNKTKRRQVVRLRNQGKTYKEIAEEMGVSFSTARNAYLLETEPTTTTTTTLPLKDQEVPGLFERIWRILTRLFS
jgi:transposase